MAVIGVKLTKDQKDFVFFGITEALRLCRRLQLLSRMEHHEQDDEQVFPRSARAC